MENKISMGVSLLLLYVVQIDVPSVGEQGKMLIIVHHGP